MTRLSQTLIPTSKSVSGDHQTISDRHFTQAGLIYKHGLGLFTYMPAGLRVLRKIEALIRRHMNAAGAIEVLMPFIQPAELWEKSGRWNAMTDEMGKFKDRHGKWYALSPTQEEVVTDLFAGFISSYKALPINLYHINVKFRDEIRPRFGLMRAREFSMMDAYSFHMDFDSLERTYEAVGRQYALLLDSLGVKWARVRADTGAMGGRLSHEFHILAEKGEDELLVCAECKAGQNSEMGSTCRDCGSTVMSSHRGIEVGHIFQLGDKYTKSMKVTVKASDGADVAPIMGCYGLGVSRIMAAVAEQLSDESGLSWPRSLAPYAVLVTAATANDLQRNLAEDVYKQLLTAGFEVLLDDSNNRLGHKLRDAELLGLQHVVIVGRDASSGQVELKSGSVTRQVESVDVAKAILDDA